MNRISFNAIFIIAIFIATDIFLAIRTYNHLFILDEVDYHYMFKEDSFTANNIYNFRDKEPLHSFRDVIESQITHYKHFNGRALVTFSEQLFSGILPFPLFIILNCIIFDFLCIGIVKLSFSITLRQNPLPWLITILSLLYLFPESETIYTSLNLSPNYLWPITLAVWAILSLSKSIHSSIPTGWAIPSIILCFVCGWSNEAISLPLSATLLTFLLFNPRKFSKLSLILTLSLWLGTLLIVLAPGTSHRVDASITFSPITLVNHFCILISQEKLFLLLMLTMGILCIKHAGFIKITYKDRKHIFVLLFWSIFLVFFAHTSPRSFICGEFASLLIILYWANAFFLSCDKRLQLDYITLILALLFIIHQYFIARDTIAYHKIEKNILESYKTSIDAVVLYPDTHFSFFSRRFIREIDETNGINGFGHISTISMYSGRKDTMILLRPGDFDAVKNTMSFYIPYNRIAKELPIYYSGGSWYWIHPDSISSIGKLYYLLHPVSFSENVPLPLKLKFAFCSTLYPDTQSVNVDTLHTINGNYYRFPAKFDIRRIKSIESFDKD